MLRTLFALFLSFTIQSTMSSAPAAFPATDPGHFEIKSLPAGTLLQSSVEGDYFSNSARLFRPLFRYISDHNIAMTVPVETRSDPGAMLFWVASTEVAKVTGDRDTVRVVELPQRMVAAHGRGGAYSARNFLIAREALIEWVNTQQDWEPAGEAYGVYWNGPLTPWFLKRFEVHLPVRPVLVHHPLGGRL